MAQGLGPALLLAAGALANLEHIQTTCHALREEDCETEACVRAVRWAHQPRLGHGCKHMFFDVGANVGLHGRFLYEPGRFRRKKHGILRATPYHVIFKEIWPGWPGDNSEACVVAIEPNPAHRAWLTKQAVAYQKKGWRYVAVFAAAGAAAVAADDPPAPCATALVGAPAPAGTLPYAPRAAPASAAPSVG